MNTVAQISQEIQTTITELGNGGVEITVTHINGESKTSRTMSSNPQLWANALHTSLVNRIVRQIELAA